ncbi:hypothetical protein HanRHA438_Chr08g0366401 [Helianthus annuus]|nr:hypothetical protein HanRHA438_Chr08g0366401 [Helianthus annuus]
MYPRLCQRLFFDLCPIRALRFSLFIPSVIFFLARVFIHIIFIFLVLVAQILSFGHYLIVLVVVNR